MTSPTISAKPDSSSWTAKLAPWAVLLTLCTTLWNIPHPEAITQQAWQLLAIFITTIAGIILKPLPMGAMAFLGLVGLCVTNTLPLAEALTAFSSPSVWLIVIAFFIARGFIITGLGRRIALYFLTMFGKHSLGLGYGIVLSDLLIAPAIPSSTARCGGVILPIVHGIADSLDSHPHKPSASRIGGFLNLVAFHTTMASSCMFVTAMAANPLAMQLSQESGLQISWGLWALAASVPGLLSLAVLPYVIYRCHPPTLKDTSSAASDARNQLKAMGSFSMSEKIMLGTFVLMIGLWIGGPFIGVHPTLAAMVGLALLLVTGILNWDEVKKESSAWDTLMWFAVLVMMASQLNKLGLMDWLGATVGGSVGGMSWPIALFALSLVYFYSHYLFASNTAHVSAMFVPFLAVALAVGAPPLLAGLCLCYLSAMCGGLTHYGCGHAPLLFAAGYVDLKTWWRVGFIVCTVSFMIWMLTGPLWWRLLGLW